LSSVKRDKLEFCSLKGGRPEDQSPPQEGIPGCSSALGYFHFHDLNACQSPDISVPFHPDYTGKTRVAKKAERLIIGHHQGFLAKTRAAHLPMISPIRLFSQFRPFARSLSQVSCSASSASSLPSRGKKTRSAKIPFFPRETQQAAAYPESLLIVFGVEHGLQGIFFCGILLCVMSESLSLA